MLIAIALSTMLATFIGGLFALHFRDKLHLILGFSAGAVVGVAFFDLLPESIALASRTYAVSTIASIAALGFALYLLLDRLVTLHVHTHEDDQGHPYHRAYLGAGSLAIHSLLDGIGIGLAFKVSPTVGVVVTSAVLAHDFSDGINTVSMIIRNKGSRNLALRWLITDALAPVVGIMAVQFFTVSENVLGLLLALFCGFFLYIGASDLLPESHHNHPTFYTTLATLAGMIVLFVVVRVASL